VAGLRKNGKEFPVELSISPVRDGKSVLFVGCLRDITERNALRLARGEVSRVTQRMAMGEMAAAIVREISQPLEAVAANANAGLRRLAGSAPGLDKVSAVLQRIVNDSQRANEVIDKNSAHIQHRSTNKGAIGCQQTHSRGHHAGSWRD
jgi:signal transduction histidine kinase